MQDKTRTSYLCANLAQFVRNAACSQIIFLLASAAPDCVADIRNFLKVLSTRQQTAGTLSRSPDSDPDTQRHLLTLRVNIVMSYLLRDAGLC